MNPTLCDTGPLVAVINRNDLADASLISTANTLGLTRIFTFDRHFYAYRIHGRALEVFP